MITSHSWWNYHCDQRVVNDWLMHNGPYKLLIISITYLLAIHFGKKWMQHRKPFVIRWPMFAYNLSLIVVNLYFFYHSFWWINYGRDLFNFRFPSPNDYGERATNIVRLYYYYQMSKFFDYFDTAFLILRKKQEHITVLHVYHHVSVPIVGWLANWMSPTMPALGLFAMLNSFCHIFMYSYYLLSLFTHNNRRHHNRSFKRYVTIIQLIQFLILGSYGLCLNVYHENYPKLFRMLIISQAIIYLILFGNFYKHSYTDSYTNNK